MPAPARRPTQGSWPVGSRQAWVLVLDRPDSTPEPAPITLGEGPWTLDSRRAWAWAVATRAVGVRRGIPGMRHALAHAGLLAGAKKVSGRWCGLSHPLARWPGERERSRGVRFARILRICGGQTSTGKPVDARGRVCWRKHAYLSQTSVQSVCLLFSQSAVSGRPA